MCLIRFCSHMGSFSHSAYFLKWEERPKCCPVRHHLPQNRKVAFPPLKSQSKHIPRLLEYHSVCPVVWTGTSRPIPSHASECAPNPGTKGGGGHTPLRVWEWGSPISSDWSLALCLLCVINNTRQRLIEVTAKCRHVKNGSVKGLCGRCLSEFIDWR
jgi:hypothetical protein